MLVPTIIMMKNYHCTDDKTINEILGNIGKNSKNPEKKN
jgi:hypothetical protein